MITTDPRTAPSSFRYRALVEQHAALAKRSSPKSSATAPQRPPFDKAARRICRPRVTEMGSRP